MQIENKIWWIYLVYINIPEYIILNGSLNWKNLKLDIAAACQLKCLKLLVAPNI